MNLTELIKTDKKLYKCDECKGTFKSSEVKLVDPADNVKILTPGYKIMCVEKDGTICGKQNPLKDEGDRLLSCPKCGQLHLNGFDSK